ncbi:MAG TPA: LysR family transcriptional regulator [Paucimonas sp.]|nr:LysR family transcriptional regulator [Paucimonas sp.]
MLDRFEDLQTFVTVVQAKGFGKAALRIGIAKSAVSRRVQELEDRLGARLLNRSTRAFSLTQVGEEFYARAVQVLADLQEAEALASTGSVDPLGTLRVSGPVSFGILHLAPVIGQFLDRHLQLQIDLDLNDRFVDLVDEGFDVAVRIGHLKDSSLIARRIATIRHAVCASPDYLARHGVPKTPADLKRHRGLVYSNVDEAAYWRFHDPDGGRPYTAEAGSVLRINNGDALREAALAGHGIAVLPTFIIHRAVAAGGLRIVLPEYARAEIDLHAVYPSRRNVPAKVRVFVDFLVERFGAEPYWDRDLEQGRRDGRGAHSARRPAADK